MLALGIIPIFTFFSGFINAVNVENESPNFWECSFLGEPTDRHADLVKSTLALYSGPPLETWDWSPHYRTFYEHNYYGKMEDVPKGRLTPFSLPPLTLLIATGWLQEILWTGPLFVVATHYILACLLMGFLCWALIVDRKEQIFAFISLMLSYPFLIILTTGNYPALFVGVSLILYIYLACNRRHFIWTVVLLAIACNMRPNAILLAPLLLCFGLRKAIMASALLFVIGGAIALVSYEILTVIYPGYSLGIFLKALSIYYQLYVVGMMGDFNNSALYGTIKFLYRSLFLEQDPDVLMIINKSIGCVVVGFITWFSFKFWRGRIPAYHFALALVCLYILGSTVVAPYHLLVLYVFIFMAGSNPSGISTFPLLPVIVAVAVLIPKSYFFFYPAISCEGILNALVLSVGFVWILTSDSSSVSQSGSLVEVATGEIGKKIGKHGK